jgi:hypothetical protein
MAQKKITDLQLIDAVTDSLSIPADDSIQSYRLTGSQLKAYILANNAILTAMINNDAVTTSKILNAAITRAKLATGAIANVSSTSKTSDYTADAATDDIILVDATANTVTIALPAASGCTGKKFNIKRIDSSNTYDVVIDPNSAETIDGAATVDLINQFDSIEIMSDGTNWFITANNRKKESVTFSTATTAYTMTANTWITAPLSTVYGNGKYSLSSNAWTVKKTSLYRLIMQNSVISGNGELVYLTYSVNGASESSNYINGYLMDANASGSTGHFTEIRDVSLAKGDVIRLRVQCATNTRSGNNGRMTVLEL